MRQNKKFWHSVYLIVLAITLFGLIPGSNLLATDKIKVVVSIPPEKIFVSEIGEDQVDVTVLVGSGQSPATYDPTPSQMVALAEADIYFRIGVPFENRLLTKLENNHSSMKIVDLRDGIQLRPITGEHHDGHQHGATDPHIWMDPVLVKTITGTIAKSLTTIQPESERIFNGNLIRFNNIMDTIDSQIAGFLKNTKTKDFLIFHPTLGYFSDRYGLNQIPIEYEGKEPGAKYIAELIDIARAKNIKVIFAQPQFSEKSAEVIANAIGARVIKADHLPDNLSDYIFNLMLVTGLLTDTTSEGNQ